MPRLSPDERLARYGPTTGDRVRLGDTDLWVRVADDRQAPGDEPIWGYAKTIRPRATQGRPSDSELDVVVAGVLVLDPVLGAIKADIGIKDGRIVGVGRAGNPGISEGIELPIGPHTQPIMGYGLIATPGAVDSHVHLISPQLLPAALSGGVTTLLTAGFEEPPAAMHAMLAATADWPLNVGLAACARAEDDASLLALLDAGACGFKIHEDYGAHPELIDHVLRFADAHDVAVALHTDGLHESAELEDTVAAIAGRTIHAYHVEGSGGGHVGKTEAIPVPIMFVYNEATLTPDGKHAANLLLEYLTLKRLSAVELTGHADERGTTEYNMDLSRDRLAAVSDLLKNGGYSGELKLTPKGKSEPFTGVDRERFSGEALYQLDRRVELRVAR